MFGISPSRRDGIIDRVVAGVISGSIVTILAFLLYHFTK